MTEKFNLPKVSIVTVVFNGEDYLEETIQSVIKQDYPHFEYLIIDGGSKDDSVKIIKKYEQYISYWISEPDEGIYDAMNKGLKQASGDWINFLNGGDTFFDCHIISKIFGLPEVSNKKFIYGDSYNIAGNSKSYIKAKRINKNSLKKNLGLCHQAVFVQMDHAPEYNLNLKYKAEYKWVIDIIYRLNQYEILHFPYPVVNYAHGGFSEKGLLENLKEQIKLTRILFGNRQIILNSFFYIRVYLRYWKYKLFGLPS